MDLTPLFPGEPAVPEDLSFAGGRAVLSPTVPLPHCRLCDSALTFFLQVRFPDDHAWAGHLLAVFACTACCDEEHLIPPMHEGPLAGARLPAGFTAQGQSNFRFVTSPVAGARLRDDWPARIARQAWTARRDPAAPLVARVGGEPEWLLDPEAPAACGANTRVDFLLQLPEGLVFPRAPGAPPQRTLDLAGEAVDSDADTYDLFLGNALYLYGFWPPDGDNVYAITQV